MSKAAEDTLKRLPSHNQGTKVLLEHAKGNAAALLDLHEAGLTGPLGGLTRKGSIVAQRLQNEQLETLF